MNSVTSGGVINQLGKLYCGQGTMDLFSAYQKMRLQAGAGAHQIQLDETGARSVTINTPTIINSNLTVTGFIAAKPYVSLRVITSGGLPRLGPL